jgi:hypothetical protein
MTSGSCREVLRDGWDGIRRTRAQETASLKESEDIGGWEALNSRAKSLECSMPRRIRNKVGEGRKLRVRKGVEERVEQSLYLWGRGK